MVSNNLDDFIELIDCSNNNSKINFSQTSLVINKSTFDKLLRFFESRNINTYTYDANNKILFLRLNSEYYVIKVRDDISDDNLTEEEISYLDSSDINYQIYTDETDKVFNYDKIVNKKQPISIRKHARFIDFPRHRHDYIELIYVKSGKLVNVTDKEKIVMGKGDVFLMNQEVYHSIEATSYEDEIYNFLIHPEFFKVLIRLFREDEQISKFFIKSLDSYSNNVAEYVYFKYNGNVENEMLFDKLIFLFENYEENIGKIKILIGYIFCNIISDRNCYYIVNFNNFEQNIVVYIQNYIIQNYRYASLNDLSKKLNMKPYQLSKLIKCNFGDTFNNMVTKEKMDNAKKLLMSTNLTLDDISDYIGYSSLSHFHNIFKKSTNMTPIEYRKQKLQK